MLQSGPLSVSVTSNSHQVHEPLFFVILFENLDLVPTGFEFDPLTFDGTSVEQILDVDGQLGHSTSPFQYQKARLFPVPYPNDRHTR